MATEACGGGTPDLSSVLEVLRYVGIYGYKGYIGGPKGGPRGRGAHPRGGTLVTDSCASWSRVQVSWITFGEKITFPKILFRLDSV